MTPIGLMMQTMGAQVAPVSSDERELAEIIRQIQQMQIQNGLRRVSPLGQGYYPLDKSPAPPGYRLNEAPTGNVLDRLAGF